MSRQISDAGLTKIKLYEGLRLKAYADGGGVWTIGYGHTSDVSQGDTCTEEEATAFLREDVATAERFVDKKVDVDLTDNQFAALVSFTYNVGTGNFLKSTLLKKLNASEFTAVPKEFMKWTHDHRGNVEAGLVTRRASEAAMFVHGTFASSASVMAIPAPSTVGKLQKIGSAITAVSISPDIVAKATGQVQTVADFSPLLHTLFIILTVLGVGVTMWGMFGDHKESKATT